MQKLRSSPIVKACVVPAIFCCFVAAGVRCSAQSFPPPTPSGALGDVDTKFLQAYTARMKALEDSHLLYVEVSGSSMTLHRNGQAETQPILPEIYHALKDVAHIPFLTYLRLQPFADAGESIPDNDVSALEALSSSIVDARAALDTGHFDDDQIGRQRLMIEKSLGLLQSAISRKRIDPAELARFAAALGPLMMENSNDAACYQVHAMHAQMMKWKTALNREEWSRLVIVNVGGHQPRYRNLATQYFAWLFDSPGPGWSYPGESARLIYEESRFKTESVEDELTDILIDADISEAFLLDRWRLSEDILSDGAARCIAHLPASDRIWAR